MTDNVHRQMDVFTGALQLWLPALRHHLPHDGAISPERASFVFISAVSTVRKIRSYGICVRCQPSATQQFLTSTIARRLDLAVFLLDLTLAYPISA